jgi:hypothetical protein
VLLIWIMNPLSILAKLADYEPGIEARIWKMARQSYRRSARKVASKKLKSAKYWLKKYDQKAPEPIACYCRFKPDATILYRWPGVRKGTFAAPVALRSALAARVQKWQDVLDRHARA